MLLLIEILRMEDTTSKKNRSDENLKRREKEIYELKNRYGTSSCIPCKTGGSGLIVNVQCLRDSVLCWAIFV